MNEKIRKIHANNKRSITETESTNKKSIDSNLKWNEALHKKNFHCFLWTKRHRTNIN